MNREQLVLSIPVAPGGLTPLFFMRMPVNTVCFVFHSVRIVAIPVKDGKRQDFDYMHCKGCGICKSVCPFPAITMVRWR